MSQNKVVASYHIDNTIATIPRKNGWLAASGNTVVDLDQNIMKVISYEDENEAAKKVYELTLNKVVRTSDNSGTTTWQFADQTITKKSFAKLDDEKFGDMSAFVYDAVYDVNGLFDVGVKYVVFTDENKNSTVTTFKHDITDDTIAENKFDHTTQKGDVAILATVPPVTGGRISLEFGLTKVSATAYDSVLDTAAKHVVASVFEAYLPPAVLKTDATLTQTITKTTLASNTFTVAAGPTNDDAKTVEFSYPAVFRFLMTPSGNDTRLNSDRLATECKTTEECKELCEYTNENCKSLIDEAVESAVEDALDGKVEVWDVNNYMIWIALGILVVGVGAGLLAYRIGKSSKSEVSDGLTEADDNFSVTGNEQKDDYSN